MRKTEERGSRLPLKKLVNFRLSVFVAGALIAGIACAANFAVQKYAQGIIFAVAFFLLCAAFLIFYTDKNTLLQNILTVCALALFFAAGLLGFTAEKNAFVKEDIGGHYFSVEGKVAERTDSDYGLVLILKNVSVKGIVDGKLSYKLAAYLSDTEKVAEVGDVVSFYGYVTEYSLIYDGRLTASRLADKVKYRAETDGVTLVSHSPDIFERANLFIKRALLSGTESDEFGVAYAMLTGNSDFMSDELLYTYRAFGVAHIFAVSGLHIGFFSAAVGWLLKKLRVNKYLCAAIVIAACAFYSGVCGFSASAIRATVMCSVAFIASLCGERYDGLSALGIAATLILLYEPAQLYCAGFILSFTVVAGILVLSRPLCALFKKRLPDKAANSLAAVLSAFIFGLPALVSIFGNVSVLSIIANMLLIPIVGVLYVATFIAAVLSGITGWGAALLFLPKYALVAVNFLMTFASGAAVVITGVTFGIATLFYYLAAILPSGLINIPKTAKAISSVVMAALFIVCAVAVNVTEARTTYVVAAGTESFSVVLADTPEGAVLIVADSKKVFSPSPVLKIAKRRGIKRLSAVYLLKTANDNSDPQDVATKISFSLPMDKIVYYGKEDETLSAVMKKSFPGIELVHADDGKIKECGTIMNYALDGNAIVMDICGKSIAVFNAFGEYFAGYSGLNGDFYAIFACDYADSISAVYKPKEFCALKYYKNIKNVVSSGMVTLGIR